MVWDRFVTQNQLSEHEYTIDIDWFNQLHPNTVEDGKLSEKEGIAIVHDGKSVNEHRMVYPRSITWQKLIFQHIQGLSPFKFMHRSFQSMIGCWVFVAHNWLFRLYELAWMCYPKCFLLKSTAVNHSRFRDELDSLSVIREFIELVWLPCHRFSIPVSSSRRTERWKESQDDEWGENDRRIGVNKRPIEWQSVFSDERRTIASVNH